MWWTMHEEESNQLRARQNGYNPYYPKSIAKDALPPHLLPKVVQVLQIKRGPVQHIPILYTNQHRAFKPRKPAPPLGFILLNTYQPRVVVQPPHSFKPPMHHPWRVAMTPIGERLRSRPRSFSYKIEHKNKE